VHVSPIKQAFAHAPQLALSVCVSTQAAAHALVPPGQPQWPPEHTWSVVHTVPHPPQFALSVSSLAQYDPPGPLSPKEQRASPAPQVVEHFAFEQAIPAPHATPHAPQFALSD
jgi:hypothetical protein